MTDTRGETAGEALDRIARDMERVTGQPADAIRDLLTDMAQHVYRHRHLWPLTPDDTACLARHCLGGDHR